MSKFKNDTSNVEMLEKFKNYIQEIENIENFTYVGEKMIELNDTEDINLEIYCRYLKSTDQLEFIINDVSRNKNIDKLNAIFNYKQLFLSKIAHEFKNPIICIIELINQLKETIDTKEKENLFLTRNLSQIKSMSNFLLILVKDLNYFSEYQLGRNIQFDKVDINLNQLLEFCKDITMSLIKKLNRQNSLNFEIETTDEVPHIIRTDEWRLKQLIINLLSNAVKFTMYGKVQLKISQEKVEDLNCIKFLVKDTGSGMKEEQMLNLFQPFNKRQNNSSNNEHGSGLGLLIANEIATKLGGHKIHLESELSKGSSFWFFIPLELTGYPPSSYIFASNANINEDEIFLIEEEKESSNDDSESSHNSSNDSSPTVQNDFTYVISQAQFLSLQDLQKRESQEEIKLKSRSFTQKPNFQTSVRRGSTSSSHKTPFERFDFSVYKDCFNIIIADDESLSRQSSTRIISNLSKEYGLNLNVFQVEDGVETFYFLYKCMTNGVKISFILSDENMAFLNGSKSFMYISKLMDQRNLNSIPFYLLTALDSSFVNSDNTFEVLSKPLTRDTAMNILKTNFKL